MIQEKNKLSNSGYTIVLFEITVPGLADPIRITSDNINTTWNSETYVAFPFELDEISEASTGEIPTVELRVSNHSRALERYLQDYDVYVKANGISPIDALLSVVHSAHLNLTTAEVEYEFRLKKPMTDQNWARFTLAGDNLFLQRFPLNKMYKNRCRYRSFKGTRCGYTGAVTTCDRSLSACRALSNSTRFGGFPGMGRNPIFI
jgi:phage-related protein